MAVEFNPGGAASLNAAVKTRYEANTDTNAFTDAEKTKLTGIATGATANSADASLLARANHTGTQAISTITDLQTTLDAKQDEPAEGAFVDGDKTKLDGIEAGATANTGALADLDAVGIAQIDATGTPGSSTFLRGDGAWAAPAGGGGGDLLAANNLSDLADATIARTNLGVAIGTDVQAVLAEGAFVDGDKTKLDGIEASADVTDTANVEAAGALMDSEVANLAAVKAFDPTDYATAAQGATADSALQNLSEDVTPQLGGDLDGQGNQIANYVNSVVTASGVLTAAAHGGNILVTSGNVTVPTTAGFSCILIAGGAHTVTFNGTTSAAMAAGDIMTIAVQSGTVIHAVLTAAADKVSFA